MTKVNAFVKEFVAKVKGDDTKALAMKVWRKAESALKTQIAVMEGDVIKLEDDVTNGEEKLAKARVNKGTDITDRDKYVDNLIEAENIRRSTEKALKDHNTQLTFLKDQYAALKKEVTE